MKIGSINSNVAFSGYKQVKTSTGEKVYTFNHPFDDEKYNFAVEICKAEKTKDGYKVRELLKTVPLDNSTNNYVGSIKGPFAYRYLQTYKNGNPVYDHEGKVIGPITEAGKIVQGDYGLFNYVPDGYTGKAGAQKLIAPDLNNDYVFNAEGEIVPNENILKDKNYAMKSGGSIAGIIKDLDDGKLNGYSRVVGLPVFGDDPVTHHGYWTRNIMQMTQSMGSINQFATMLEKMFAKGINWAADGAFVNEGLEGIHFKYNLRWGNRTPIPGWFRMDLDNPVKLGIFSKHNQEHINSRIVKEHGKNYIQIYDNRLVKDLKKKELIEAYNKDPDNPLDIISHHDTVILYTLELEDHILRTNMKRAGLKEKDAYNYEETRALLKSTTWEAEEKFEGGFETWEANPDILKLNYTTSNTDALDLINSYNVEADKQKLARANFEVQDLAITAGRYWTKKADQVLNLHAAQQIGIPENEDGTAKDANKILHEIEGSPNLPSNIMGLEVIDNVLKGNYKLKEQPDMAFDQQILKGLMEVPLDSVEVGDEISGVLSSPLMSKRAQHVRDLGKSRYDMYLADNPADPTAARQYPGLPQEYKKSYKATDAIYTDAMLKLTKDILNKAEFNEPITITEKLADGKTIEKVTEYGKYVLPIISAEVARFALIKGLHKDAAVNIDKETGEISYNYKELKKHTLYDIGVKEFSPQSEAVALAKKIKNGINSIKDDHKKPIADAITTMFANTNTKSFDLAQVMVDRAGAGLDWRLDAAKDIADVEGMRNGFNQGDDMANQVIDFWKKFADGVKNENPNAYIAAEVTNPDAISPILEHEFLASTGVTTTANYNFLFHAVSQIFSSNFEKGGIDDNNIFKSLAEMLNADLYDGLVNSYTFIGNHDKARSLHCLAIDMDLFFAKLMDRGNTEMRKRAYKVLEGKDWPPADYPFNEYSTKAIAVGEAINNGFNSQPEYLKSAARAAVADLAKGFYKGDEFDATGFGVKPFDITIDLVLDQMEHNGYEFETGDRKKVADAVFEAVLKPATEKLKQMMKVLVALPGFPTLFDGDQYGATGFEADSKNIFVQNRARLHTEWTEGGADEKDFITKLDKELKKIMTLRSRPELRPLNDGAVFTLAPNDSTKWADWDKEGHAGVLRQSTDGAMTVSMIRKQGHKSLGCINMCNGLPGGVRDGLVFYDANDLMDLKPGQEPKHKVKYVTRGNTIVRQDGGNIEIDHSLILYHKLGEKV